MKYSSVLIATIMSRKQNRKRKREDTERESRILDIVKNNDKFPLPDYLPQSPLILDPSKKIHSG